MTYIVLKAPLNSNQPTLNTVKPLMLTCSLFHKLNKTAKLKDANIDTKPTLIGILCFVGIVVWIYQNKRCQNNFAT